MDNLLTLAWIPFRVVLFGIIGFVCYLVLRVVLRKKDTNPDRKKLAIILALLIVCRFCTGIPYVFDYIAQETQKIEGEVVEVNSSTYKGSRTVYAYTVQIDNGDQIVLYAPETYQAKAQIDVGLVYEMIYYSHSKTVMETLQIDRP